MGETTHIAWTDHTFNPWEGCTKVSAGCANCYAEARDKRFTGGTLWGKGKARRRTSKSNWNLPLKWNRAAADELAEWSDFNGGEAHYEKPHNPSVFCASLADWLDDEVPIEWLADLLKVIHDTPNLTWQLLTKRPENCRERMNCAMDAYCGGENTEKIWNSYYDMRQMVRRWVEEDEPPSNIWIGTSTENQTMADKRIPELLNIPAKVRFLSVEPMLERIDLSNLLSSDYLATGHASEIGWCIYGGESGTNARPCNIDWIRDGVKQCQASGVKVFVKQLGGNLSNADLSECSKASGKSMQDKKGGDMAEWPTDLQVREFPV